MWAEGGGERRGRDLAGARHGIELEQKSILTVCTDLKGAGGGGGGGGGRNQGELKRRMWEWWGEGVRQGRECSLAGGSVCPLHMVSPQ